MSTSPKAEMTFDAAFNELVTRLRESGISDADIDEHLFWKVGEWSTEENGSGTTGLLERCLDLGNLLAIPPNPIDWLVRGLLGTGDIVNLAAKWGVGKTWFALDLALTIADKEREGFLGRPVKRGKVIFVDEESTEDMVRERLALLGARASVSENIYYLLQTGIKLTDSAATSPLYEAVADVKPVLVVFDSLTRFYSGLDENNANDMAKLTDVISPLSRDYGAAVLLIDHGTKGGSRDPSNAARGSGEKAAGVDRLWSLEGDESGLTLTHGKTRRGKTPPPVAIRRVSSPEADTYSAGAADSWPLGQVGVWHEALGEVAGGQSSDPHLALVEALKASGGSLPMAEVVGVVYGGHRDRMNRSLKDAERRGRVRREPHPTDGRVKLVVLLEDKSKSGMEEESQVA